MTIIIIAICILLCVSVYININQNNKISKYEEVVIQQQEELELMDNQFEDFHKTIIDAHNQLKEIDAKGSFESDDETGAIFKQIQDTIKQLDSYKGEEE